MTGDRRQDPMCVSQHKNRWEGYIVLFHIVFCEKALFKKYFIKFYIFTTDLSDCTSKWWFKMIIGISASCVEF